MLPTWPSLRKARPAGRPHFSLGLWGTGMRERNKWALDHEGPDSSSPQDGHVSGKVPYLLYFLQSPVPFLKAAAFLLPTSHMSAQHIRGNASIISSVLEQSFVLEPHLAVLKATPGMLLEGHF